MSYGIHLTLRNFNVNQPQTSRNSTVSFKIILLKLLHLAGSNEFRKLPYNFTILYKAQQRRSWNKSQVEQTKDIRYLALMDELCDNHCKYPGKNNDDIQTIESMLIISQICYQKWGFHIAPRSVENKFYMCLLRASKRRSKPRSMSANFKKWLVRVKQTHATRWLRNRGQQKSIRLSDCFTMSCLTAWWCHDMETLSV